ncbi:unnamed protein product [Pleuronectes platessa]|uniref:LRRNT domain-containing protein n=1 Tax=Pleuronectes platessa TaxID=8262 RepID=A0A9N7VI47_PLEPL|nr:unnamed protein product [Pleuronectes platessa]
MDLWFHSIRICWWRVLFLMSVFQDYLSSMLDCPPTCSCSQTEIYCNKSDSGRFFPLLALQDTGNNGTSVDIAELFKNISTINKWRSKVNQILLSLASSGTEATRPTLICPDDAGALGDEHVARARGVLGIHEVLPLKQRSCDDGTLSKYPPTPPPPP